MEREEERGREIGRERERERRGRVSQFKANFTSESTVCQI